MTVVNPSDFDGMDTGLEDFDMTDAVIPRLSIVHKEGEFKDSLSNEQFPKLRVIILGLVKQRALWHPDIEDGDWPMCRSVNFEVGLPNMSDEQPKAKRFPWAQSGFDSKDYPPDRDSGVVRLPCNGCALKEWKSHPDGKRPYCTEQWTLPVLYDPRDDENWVPAIVTFQKTGLKPLKSYITSFARSRQPAFTAITEIGLDQLKRGTTEYSVPNFKRVGDTDDVDWRGYSVNFRTMKDFLTAEPGSRDDDEGSTPSVAASSDASTKEDPWATPAEPAATEPVEEPPATAPEEKKPEAAAPAAPPVAPGGDDDLPF